MRLRLALMLTMASCSTAATLPDFAVNPPGCRFPSACFKLDVDGGVLCDPTPEIVCGSTTDPTGGQNPCANVDLGLLVCPEGSVCLEAVQACVGRGPICEGVGARCVSGDESCDGTTGIPPQRAGDEPHCAQ